MSTLADLAAAAVADRKLMPRDMAAAPGWQFWELRTLNIHRVVGLWRYKPRAMGIPILEAEARAMKLPIGARAQLAHRLIESLEDSDTGDFEAEWIEEAERRYAAYRAGVTVGRPGAEVFRQAKSRLE